MPVSIRDMRRASPRRPSSRRPSGGHTLNLFSFGYWGWGGATDALLRLTDAVEAKRGFAPPLFVDIRMSRAGRSEGFRGDAFEQRLGFERYRWMRTLGNLSIKTGENRIQIASPHAVDQLLDLALDARRDGRRVIFFCACETPRRCHRRVVGRLVLRAARKRGIPVNVAEWPSGPVPTDVALDMRIRTAVYDGIIGKQVWLPLPRTVPHADVAVLGLGAVARLRAVGRRPALAVLGAVRSRDARWCVEKVDAREEGEGWDETDAARRGRRERLRRGHLPLG